MRPPEELPEHEPGTGYDLDTLPARLATAASHVVTSVPVAAPTDRVGAVRASLAGRRYALIDDVVVCDAGRLVGVVALERLFAAGDDQSVGDVMDPDPAVIAPHADQAAAAWAMVRKGQAHLAVVDEDERLVGMVPSSAMLEVLLREHHEDLDRLGGVLAGTREARAASEEPVRRRLWHRLPWLLVGLAGAMVSAVVMGSFEAELEANVVLAFFLPAVVYMADAVGTQTETLAIRGISVGVPLRDVLGKEVLTGLLVGVLIAAAFVPFALIGWGDATVALVVGIALLGACSVATVVALVLPWLLDRLGKDPAFGSGPLATVVQDLLSILIYLATASALL